MSHVTVKGLEKKYGETAVVSSFSLEITEGSFVSLLGPSGCGKTTILRMVAGLETPTAGIIRFGTETVYDDQTHTSVPPEKRNVGMVFQSYAVWPHMTVFDNVAFPLKCRKIPKESRMERVEAALKMVRMDSLAQRKPHQLSGGQQQRIALARALVARPSVILLDEPLCNLDANLRDEMCDELLVLRKNFPHTMIYVTHEQSEAYKLSDRIALLNGGRLEQFGTGEELRKKPTSDFVKRFLKL